jgi:hypothetical protein
MKIQVMVKTVYGKDLIYPVCETARLLAELTRKKTLDEVELALIKKLGFTVEFVPYQPIK